MKPQKTLKGESCNILHSSHQSELSFSTGGDLALITVQRQKDQAWMMLNRSEMELLGEAINRYLKRTK